MERSRGHVALVAPLILLALAGCTDRPGPDEPRSTQGPAALAEAWAADLADRTFVPAVPNSGESVVALHDSIVVLGRRSLTSFDPVTGEEQWQAVAPADLCASAPTDSGTGIVAVLTGVGDDCSRVVAFDADSGERLWSRAIPDADEALGQSVAVGRGIVTVTGGCVGYTRFRIGDGSIASSDRGTCASAASDGATIVTADDHAFTVIDAASGRVERRVPARGLDRVGQVLSADPLVVTARLRTGRTLVDLSAAEPLFFGEDKGGYGGEVPAWARSGDTLWVQYDQRTVAGFDLAAGAPVAAPPLDLPGDLVGATDDAVYVVTDESVGHALVRFAVTDIQDPETVGDLPPAPAAAGPVRAGRLVGSLLLTVRVTRVDALTLP